MFRMSSMSRSLRSADSTRIIQASTAVVVLQILQGPTSFSHDPRQAQPRQGSVTVWLRGASSSRPSDSKNARRRSSSSPIRWLRISSARFQPGISSHTAACRSWERKS